MESLSNQECVTAVFPGGANEISLSPWFNQFSSITARDTNGNTLGSVNMPIPESGITLTYDLNADGQPDLIGSLVKCIDVPNSTSTTVETPDTTTTSTVDTTQPTTPNSSTTTTTTTTIVETPGTTTTTTPETVVSQPPREKSPNIPAVGADVGAETALASVLLAAGLTLAGIKRYTSRNRRTA